MIEKTNQPYSFMIADVEKSEKELLFAHKKIKKMEEEVKRLNRENEQLVLVRYKYVFYIFSQRKV